MGYLGNFFLPESGKYLVLFFELINPDYFAPKFSALLVEDQRPVTIELPDTEGRLG